MTMSWHEWWDRCFVDGVDRRSVMDQVRADSGWSSHYAFMIVMSAGIAVLGLLLSSPAIVIGAMLISPLMGPTVGLGFALATLDSREVRQSAAALAVGILLAFLVAALVVLFSPLQTVTTEISSRTRPNLFDLLVALFAGLAGTYAMIRGRGGTIVGVIIATALMPPLAVTGFGLATANWPILEGAALLFFTNLVTIAVAAAVLARLYGFARNLSPQQSGFQIAILAIAMALFAVPLAISLDQIARQSFAERRASSVIAAQFPKRARVSDLEIDYRARPVEVSATVFTPHYRAGAEQRLRPLLSKLLHEPTAISLDQILIEEGSDVTAPPTAAQRSASRMAERLALVAGVPVERVLIDRAAKRAVVRATPIPGASLASYQALENRVDDLDSSWTVNLIPPFLPLPDIAIEGGNPDHSALDTAIWAGRRLRLPIEVSGGLPDDRQKVASALRNAGVETKVKANGGESGPVVLRWLLPATNSEQD